MLTLNDIAHVFRNLAPALTELGYKPEITPFTFARANLTPARLWATVRAIRKAPFVYVNYALFAFLPRLLGKPYVVHCHGTDVRENLSNRWRLLTLYGLRGARWIFYSTPDLGDCLPQECRSRASFLPNPISESIFTRPAAERIDTSGIHVFFISKQDRTKGVEHFEAIAVKLVSDPRIDRVTMFAHGNAHDKCSIMHRKLQYLPPLQYEDMIAALDKCDIAIGQLQLGVMGMTELEAMARSKPLIMKFDYDSAYDEPPPICNAACSEEALSAIDKLLSNKNLRLSFGNNERNWTKKYHSAQSIANQLAIRLKACGLQPSAM